MATEIQTYTKLVIKRESKKVLLDCATCGGNGRFKGTCHVCDGVGVVVAKSPRIKCRTCGGDGRYKGTCHNCNGYGSVHTSSINEY